MGVKHLWKTLETGGAVEQLDGSNPQQHDQILEELEGTVVAIDLSAWLVQAQSQPALVEHYNSDYACCLKVVFDRTIHWLRHGCLPLFVVEGATPAAKLEKLRLRCVAQFGPQASQWRVGNTASGRFSSLGRKVTELLDLLGIPWVQADGEGEAMCAALNMCGWAQGCHTADVDALLFGAVTVYRTLSLHTAQPKSTQMARCRRAAVQRRLGLQSGGTQALIAVAQLAGGDYDLTGAERVGDVLALRAVACLLKGKADDQQVLESLQAALDKGTDPRLDALTKCTGCKCCGHESGNKASVKQHGKKGCAKCGTDGAPGGGCVPSTRDCECEFHRTTDERLLNRVVRRAVQTPGFLESCRVAADTYASEARQAVQSVRSRYDIAQPNGANVFTWRRRPDVRGVTALMCTHIPEWDYNQVRLKLLPLLLEWDVRCGPAPAPSSAVQLRPTAIKKVSGSKSNKPPAATAEELEGGDYPLPLDGWRYVVEVERLGGPAAVAGSPAGGGGREAEEDLRIDAAWLAGTARSRPPKAGAAAGAFVTPTKGGGAGRADEDDEDDEDEGAGGQGRATQGTPASQRTGGASGSGAGAKKQHKSLPFAEHRSVRCTLAHELWPHLVRAYQERGAAAAAASAKKAARQAAAASLKAAKGKGKAAAAAAGPSGHQSSLKDFFAVKKKAVETVEVGSGSGPAAATAAAAAAKGGHASGSSGGHQPLPPGRGLGGFGLAPAAAAAAAAAAAPPHAAAALPKERQPHAPLLAARSPAAPKREEHAAAGADGLARRPPAAAADSSKAKLDRFLLKAAADDIWPVETYDPSEERSGGSEDDGGSDHEGVEMPRLESTPPPRQSKQQQRRRQQEREEAKKGGQGRQGVSASQPIELCSSSGDDGDAAEEQRRGRGQQLRRTLHPAGSGPPAVAFVGSRGDGGGAGGSGAGSGARDSPDEAPRPLAERLRLGSSAPAPAAGQQRTAVLCAPSPARARAAASSPPPAGSPAKKACTPDAKARQQAASQATSPLAGVAGQGGDDWTRQQYLALLDDGGEGGEGEEPQPPKPRRGRQLFRQARDAGDAPPPAADGSPEVIDLSGPTP